MGFEVVGWWGQTLFRALLLQQMQANGFSQKRWIKSWGGAHFTLGPVKRFAFRLPFTDVVSKGVSLVVVPIF